MRDPESSPEIIGHRGAPRDRVENTIPAFSRALQLGAEAVELDVHATRDGVVVVHHDFTPRAAGTDGMIEGRPIADLTGAQIAALRYDDGSAIPTLDQVLELLGTRAKAYVEIKGHGIEAAVLSVLGRHETPSAVHSFDHRAVLRAAEARPALECGVLLSSYVVEPAAVMRAARATDLWQEWGWIDEALVAEVHAAGGRVVAWTVNEPAAMRELAAMGVDALCTDVPQIARAAFREAS